VRPPLPGDPIVELGREELGEAGCTAVSDRGPRGRGAVTGFFRRFLSRNLPPGRPVFLWGGSNTDILSSAKK
jgi:hypothetical protein